MRSLSRSLVFAAILAVGLTPALASGGSSVPSAPETPSKSPEEQARDHYNWGLKARDKAWKLEERAARAGSDAERDKLLDKARNQYRRAIEDFTKAVDNDPGFYQAFSSLGYASRKIGDYDSAVRAYDTALQLEPDYAEAIEYRAEAYLALGRIDDAKNAYMRLFNLDRGQADELLAAMKRWVEQRRRDPAGVGGEAVEALATWVEQREEIARQTATVSRREGDW